MMMLTISIILFYELLNISCQIFLKHNINKIRSATTMEFMKCAIKSPLIWLSFFLIGITLIFWVIALAQDDLTVINSIDSMSYILALIGARIFLSERIYKNKILGTLFIIFGIILISLG